MHEKIYKDILIRKLNTSTNVQAPKIVIIGGQPGSGKSKIFDYAQSEIFNNDNVAQVNGDDYRMYHPCASEIFALYDKQFSELTDPDVRLWTSRLLEELVISRRNIIFETTMRNKEPLASRVHRIGILLGI